jgi:hypothetical protein
MLLPGSTADIAERTNIFRMVVPHFGKVLSAAFFQNTNKTLSGVVRLHNLASGIFKQTIGSNPRQRD